MYTTLLMAFLLLVVCGLWFAVFAVLLFAVAAVTFSMTIHDIPVYNSLIEPLHVLFTLYASFKENQHFNIQDS